MLNSDSLYLIAVESFWLDMTFEIKKYGSYSSVIVNFEVENNFVTNPLWSMEVWIPTKSDDWQKRWSVI